MILPSLALLALVLLLLAAGVATASPPPTRYPTKFPSRTTSRPTRQPTRQPNWTPPPTAAVGPTAHPSRQPTTSRPSTSPTRAPTHSPSVSPTRSPSTSPTLRENGAYFTLTLFDLQGERMVPAPTRTPSASPTVLTGTRPPTRAPSPPTRTPTRTPTAVNTMDVTEDRATKRPTLRRTRSPTRPPTEAEYEMWEDGRRGRRRRRRQLAANPFAADIPNSELPSPELVDTVAWEYLYQGVHCLVDFLIQAGGLTYSDMYLGARENANCTGGGGREDSYATCFPATFYFLVTPTGSVNPNNTDCAYTAQCPTCDEVCVFTAKFDATVRPLLYQDKLFVVGSTVSLEYRSDAKNLMPGVLKHTLSPSSRFCRADFLDPVERAKIFDESETGQPPAGGGGGRQTRSPTMVGWEYGPGGGGGGGGGSSDTTTATVVAVLGSLALLGAVFLVHRRNLRRRKKKLRLQQQYQQQVQQGESDAAAAAALVKAMSSSALLEQQKRPEYMEDEYFINLAHLLIGQPIGAGSSGQIYAARYEGSDVCIKEILVRGDILMLKQEFDTLRRLKNPHVIQLFGFAIANTMNHQPHHHQHRPHSQQQQQMTMTNNTMSGSAVSPADDVEDYDGGECYEAYQPEFPRFLLMMELMDTSLDKLILKKQQLLLSSTDDDDDASSVVTRKEHLDWALDIAKQISLGLRYIHGKEVLHCDVKPHNILLDKAGTVKLCDLGIAKVISANQKLSDSAQQQQGTVSYMSPELLTENKLTKAVDVYAFGIVMWQLFHLQPPHPAFHSHLEIIHQVVNENFRPPIDPRLDDKIAGLIQRCWDRDASLRPSFSQIIQELGNISKLENQFGTVYLETLFSVGDSVLVFTLKNQLLGGGGGGGGGGGESSGLMKGKIDAVAVNPAGGFVYNVVLQDGSKIYALHPSDMLLQKPDPAEVAAAKKAKEAALAMALASAAEKERSEAEDAVAAAQAALAAEEDVGTIGDAITRVMEEGLEVRRSNKKKTTFPRLPVFQKKTTVAAGTVSTKQAPPSSTSKRKTIGGGGVHAVDDGRPQSEILGNAESRIKTHSSAPAFRLAKQNASSAMATPAAAARAATNSFNHPAVHLVSSPPQLAPPAPPPPPPSSSSSPPPPPPMLGLSLNIQDTGFSDRDQTFKFDGSSFVFNSGMRLQESGIIPTSSSTNNLQALHSTGGSGLGGSRQQSAGSFSEGITNSPAVSAVGVGSPWGSKNANRDKYDDSKLVRVGRLGQGDAGTVYSGIHEDSMDIVAIKEVTKFFDRDVRMQAKRELEALLELEHEHIVQLYSVYFNSTHSSITFVLEYVLGGSLKDLISAYEKITSNINEQMLKSIACDLVSALAFCHENKIAHLDVKPANVLLTLDGSAKLSDFGLARIFKDGKSALANTFIGSSLYMSPERMQGSFYSFPADIWGLGLTIAEACVGKYPISGGNKLLNFLAEFRGGNQGGGGHHHDLLVPLPKDLSAAGRDFLLACLAQEPGKRPTCVQLQQEFAWIQDAKSSRQHAVPERSNRTSRLILGEFMDSYVARMAKSPAAEHHQMAFLRHEQRENLQRKFHLSASEVQREFDDAVLRGWPAHSLTNTAGSQDSAGTAAATPQSEQHVALT